MAAIIGMDTLEGLRKRVIFLFATMGKTPTEGIPGSILADLDGDFSDADAALPHTVPSDPRQIFARCGVTEKTPVVIYSDGDPAPAARVWWLARVAGLGNAAVLDGGLQAWVASGRELGKVSLPAAPDSAQAEQLGGLNPEWERLADAPVVREALSTYNSHVVDVRAHDRYTGETPEPRPHMRQGHIPGAASLPYTEFFTSDEDGAWKLRDIDQLRDILEPIIGSAGAVTFYCGSGVTACVGALAANVAGFGDVAVYEGSWSEWGHDSQDPEEFPVATGEKP